ncbi:MAG: anaerobic ribonucleoside-triphosphate reductase activating protein [Clostridiales bacterium]|nr:anaerobic ribonucleoside-triphosphate reductase activating protein [Clostridiales bacterium]
MLISGLQKLTLLDYPGRVACTVFLGGCDFRCPFCHNSELIGSTPAAFSPAARRENTFFAQKREAAAPGTETISEEEFFAFLEKRRGLLDGVAVTGGEPTLYRDLPEFLARIHDMGFAVKLDTNGNHPQMLKQLLDAGLVDYVAMDIKNSPQRYGETIGIPGFDLSNISASISLLMNGAKRLRNTQRFLHRRRDLPSQRSEKAFPPDYEFRTTVVKEFHDDSVFPEIGQWIQGAKRYYLQCFVDRDTVLQEGLHAPSGEDLQRYVELVRPYVNEAEIRGVSL